MILSEIKDLLLVISAYILVEQLLLYAIRNALLYLLENTINYLKKILENLIETDDSSDSYSEFIISMLIKLEEMLNINTHSTSKRLADRNFLPRIKLISYKCKILLFQNASGILRVANVYKIAYFASLHLKESLILTNMMNAYSKSSNIS